MKKTKFVISLLSVTFLFAGLTACGPKAEEPVYFSFSAALESGETSVKLGTTAQIEITEAQASDYDPENPVEHVYTYESSNPSVLTVDANGLLTPVANGAATVTVYESAEDVTRKLVLDVYSGDPLTGAVTYSNSISDKAEILGKLEKYAMDESLTGISLFENGGYVMYNPRVQKGVENYITGYGFGILKEGNITSDLSSESKAKWKKYYHSGTDSDQKNINALNASGSAVSDLADYITSGYWSNKMNAEKNGYEWYPSLAKDSRPIAGSYDETSSTFTVSEDQTSKSSWFKFHVRTGADGGVKFRTASTKPEIAAYDGREVTIDDYVSAFKVLLTGGFNLFRGTELANDTSYSIVGSDAYNTATAGVTTIDDDEFAKDVKLFTGHDDGGDYLVVKMKTKVTPFYAMYGLSSSLYSPLSLDFLSTLGGGSIAAGVEKYGTFITGAAGNTATPVDTILSLGAYTLEYWEEDKTIAYKKNDSWFENSIEGMENLYRIPGVKITIYTGAQTDNTLIFKEFLKGNIDVAGIPTIDYIKKYHNDARTTMTTGDSVFKLNVNSCTQERWDELFGVNGEITQTPKENSWDVKPWMSNKNFLKGLNFSIDRNTYASNRGRIPSNEYYSSAYMIDPENGLAWNASDAHKEAMADYYPDTTGYNLSAAKIYFRQAVNELVESGQLELGTKSNPTKISIVIEWMNPSDSKDYGEEIAGYIQTAFNSTYVSQGKVKLTVVNHDGTTDYQDVYYNHLMVGQYDLGFGSISGNTLDPLNFMEVLKSNNSSGFTLNWGADTGVVDQSLIYKNQPWSFDSLWAAGDSYSIASNGVEITTFSLNDFSITRLANGGLQIDLSVFEYNNEDVTVALYALCIYAKNKDVKYSELYIYYDGTEDKNLDEGVSSWTINEDGTYTIVFGPQAVNYFETTYDATYTSLGIDLYVYRSILSLDIETSTYFTSLNMMPSFPTYVAP